VVWQIKVAARGYVVAAVDVVVRMLFCKAVVLCRCCELALRKIEVGREACRRFKNVSRGKKERKQTKFL
jgi:hypothetical protein